MSDNAIVRSILSKTLDNRIHRISSKQYSVLHHSLETAIKSALPRGTDLSKFNTSIFNRLPRNHPRRREFKQFTKETFIKKVAFSGGVHGFDTTPEKQPNTCLILSGGGAKGAFEVGFLAYLKTIWEKLNVTAVCGTSVGAVNAVPIAQSGKEGIDLLVSIWLGLQENDDMYIMHPVMEVANRQLKMVGLKGINDVRDLFGAAGLDQIRSLLEPDLKEEVIAGGVGSVIGGAAVGGPFGIILALGGLISGGIATSQAAGEINQLKTKFKMLGTALENIFSAPGLNLFAPLEKLIKNNLSVGDIGKPGMPKLRLAMVCLENGEPYYFTEKGSLIKGSADTTKARETFWSEGISVEKVRKAIIASSSMPVMFPPVVLKEDDGPAQMRETKHFLDGGVRELLPVQAGLDLGCERIIGVLSQPLSMTEQSYDKSPPSVFDYVFRIMETVTNEIALNDAKSLPEDSAIFTYPLVDIIEPFEIDPGLIRISMDYGYMRGYDATLNITGKDLGGTNVLLIWISEEMIIQLRREIWELEKRVVFPGLKGFSPVPVFNKKILRSIRKKKQELLDWTLYRFEASNNDKHSLPVSLEGRNGPATNIHDWWSTWEQHRPGFTQTALEQNDLWSSLRIGLTGYRNVTDVIEGSVPDKPTTNKF